MRKKNNEALKRFFDVYGQETGPVMTEFLHKMICMFATCEEQFGQPYRADCILHFDMLRDLVKELQDPA